VSEIERIVMVTCGVQRPSIRWGRPVIAIEMGSIPSAQRVEVWQGELGQGSVDDFELGGAPLAAVMFALELGDVARRPLASAESNASRSRTTPR
jgi:hypothetical protein